MSLFDIEKFLNQYDMEEGASISERINALKKGGASSVQIIQVLVRRLGVTISEADNIYLNSGAVNKQSVLKFRSETESEIMSLAENGQIELTKLEEE